METRGLEFTQCVKCGEVLSRPGVVVCLFFSLSLVLLSFFCHLFGKVVLGRPTRPNICAGLFTQHYHVYY